MMERQMRSQRCSCWAAAPFISTHWQVQLMKEMETTPAVSAFIPVFAWRTPRWVKWAGRTSWELKCKSATECRFSGNSGDLAEDLAWTIDKYEDQEAGIHGTDLKCFTDGLIVVRRGFQECVRARLLECDAQASVSAGFLFLSWKKLQSFSEQPLSPAAAAWVEGTQTSNQDRTFTSLITGKCISRANSPDFFFYAPWQERNSWTLRVTFESKFCRKEN